MTKATRIPGKKKTLPQRWTVGLIDVISSLEIKVLLTSVENLVTLKSDVVAALCQRYGSVKNS